MDKTRKEWLTEWLESGTVPDSLSFELDDGIHIDVDYKDPTYWMSEERKYVERVMRERYAAGDLPSTYEAFEDALKELKETTMARKERAESPFKKGRAIGRSSGGSQFLSIKPDENIVFAPMVGLDEMISADMHEYWDIRPAIFHPCIGRDCPGCQVGNESRFKGYLPVLLKDGEVAIYAFTISVYNQLEELDDELEEDDSIAGMVIKVSRKGSGMSTRYSVMPLGKRLDISKVEQPEFISQLGPQTREEIVELLEDKGFVVGDGTADAPAETPTSGDADDEWGDI